MEELRKITIQEWANEEEENSIPLNNTCICGSKESYRNERGDLECNYCGRVL